ncbi:MAG: PIN domain-containing protein [Ignavibacteriae bacterium]|nr:PIN domain-containing protein [Ignavibacteriota bacterium]
MKTKLYLDTSVPSFLFANDSPDKQAATKEFWKLLRLDIFDVFISDILLIEIARSKFPLDNQLKSAIAEISHEIVHVDDEIVAVAQKYIEEKIVPVKFRDDALHLACASKTYVDAVISWNFKHFVNLKTIRGVNGVNRILGLKEIEILTPYSFIERDSNG